MRKRKMKRCEPLDRYLELHGISAQGLAARLDMNPNTVRSMINGNRSVKAETAVHIERCIGIPRETLRPDLFVRRAA